LPGCQGIIVFEDFLVSVVLIFGFMDYFSGFGVRFLGIDLRILPDSAVVIGILGQEPAIFGWFSSSFLSVFVLPLW